MKLKEFLVPQPTRKIPTWYDRFVATLDEADKKYFDECLANRAFTAVYLSKKLRELGHNVSESAIYRYRKANNL
jgi:hypothetical protein